MQFCELRIKVNTLEFLVYLKGHYAKLAMTNNVEDIVVFTGLKVLFCFVPIIPPCFSVVKMRNSIL